MDRLSRGKWRQILVAGCMLTVGAAVASAELADGSGGDAPPADDLPAGESEGTELEDALVRRVSFADKFGERDPRPFILSGRAEHQFSTEIDTAGDFSLTRAGGAVGVLFPLGQSTAGAIGAAYTYASYDFDDAAAFGGDEAWGDVQGRHGFLIVKHLVDRNWSIIGGVVGSFTGETGASSSSSFTGGGFIGGGYRVSEDFYIQLGVNVASQLEDHVSVLPVFRLNWQIDDRWRFRAGVLETGATDTAGAGITYRFDEHWSAHGRVGYVSRRFRLDDSGFLPNGIGEESAYRAALSVTYEPNDQVQIGLIGGLTFAGELAGEDDSGERFFRENYDAVPFVSVRLRCEF